MAKVLLSKSEWQAIDDYVNFIISNPDPCDGCQDSGRCCGCPKEKAYHKKIEEIGASKLVEIKDVHQYVELSIEYTKVQKELAKAQEMVKKVSTELAEVKAKFFIEVPRTDFYSTIENTVVAEFTCAMCDRKYVVRLEDCEHFSTKDCIGLKYKCPQCSHVNTTTECRHIKND